MARPILSEFGPDASKSQASRATRGGVERFRDVMGYSPPCGPIGINRVGVGLGGENLGNCGTQQRTGVGVGESGSPGLGGENRGMGENRKG